jgi:hypothetical protein
MMAAGRDFDAATHFTVVGFLLVSSTLLSLCNANHVVIVNNGGSGSSGGSGGSSGGGRDDAVSCAVPAASDGMASRMASTPERGRVKQA